MAQFGDYKATMFDEWVKEVATRWALTDMGLTAGIQYTWAISQLILCEESNVQYGVSVANDEGVAQDTITEMMTHVIGAIPCNIPAEGLALTQTPDIPIASMSKWFSPEFQSFIDPYSNGGRTIFTGLDMIEKHHEFDSHFYGSINVSPFFGKDIMTEMVATDLIATCAESSLVEFALEIHDTNGEASYVLNDEFPIHPDEIMTLDPRYTAILMSLRDLAIDVSERGFMVVECTLIKTRDEFVVLRIATNDVVCYYYIDLFYAVLASHALLGF